MNTGKRAASSSSRSRSRGSSGKSSPEITRPAVAFRDHRGEIRDLLTHIPVDSITLISSRRGAVRGNHYHKKTMQYVYVLSGRMRYYSQVPGERTKSRVLRAGDLVLSRPMERHAFSALEDSLFLSISYGPRRGMDYEKDTFRQEPPLVR